MSIGSIERLRLEEAALPFLAPLRWSFDALKQFDSLSKLGVLLLDFID
jgi:hypothetical protein